MQTPQGGVYIGGGQRREKGEERSENWGAAALKNETDANCARAKGDELTVYRGHAGEYRDRARGVVVYWIIMI